MNGLLRVLLVAGADENEALLAVALRRGGYEPTFTRVATDKALKGALAQPAWDVVLAADGLPHLDARAALDLLKASGFDLPFIVVSDADEWDAALAAIEAGAHDVILKNALERLALTVQRELREIKGRREAKAQIERQLQHLAALRAVEIAITSSFDLRVSLSILLDQVTTQLGVDAAAVLLLNSSTQMLGYAAGRGFRTEALARFRPRLGQGPFGRAALERRAVHVPHLGETREDFEQDSGLAEEEFVATYAVPLIAKGQVTGVLGLFHRAPLNPDQEWLDFRDALAQQAAIAIDAAGLFEDFQRSNNELALAYDTTLEGWARALELRDVETKGHSQRVSELTVRLGQAIGIGKGELVHARRGALLHDIGKMGVPDQVLFKPGPLAEEEWEIVRQHPVFAYEMLLPIDYLRPALDIPYCHHEKWDGTGYPRGLRGEQIPLPARLFAVVDVWDALRSDRPYRPGWPQERIEAHVRSLAGSHFDPQAVAAFFSIDRDFGP